MTQPRRNILFQTGPVCPCPLLTSLVVTGCPRVSTEAVTRLLASRPGLRHLGHDHLDLVFRSLVARERKKNTEQQEIRIQNYEQTLTRDSAEAEEDKTLTLLVAAACPNIRTVRIRSDKVTISKTLIIDRLLGLVHT